MKNAITHTLTPKQAPPCCEEHNAQVLYLGTYVDEQYRDIGNGELFGIPPEDLRCMWIQPIMAKDPETMQPQLATALAGQVAGGQTFVFDISLAPSFAKIPLN